MSTLSRLQPGQIILLGGRRHRVAMVNESRALAVPLERKLVIVKPLTGSPVQFTRAEKGISISPNSECEIVVKEAA